MNVIDELLAHNRAYVAGHGHREMPTIPQLHLAVLTCMDSRLDLFGALGLNLGEAHLIRNAGGIASDDAVRSLLLSQRLLQTNAIMVIHHTRCGLESFQEEALQAELESTFGDRPSSSAPTTTSLPACATPSPRCARACLFPLLIFAASSLTSTTAISWR